MIVRDARDEDLVEVRGLLREYVDSLGIDLSFQQFNHEYASLPGEYASSGFGPRGAANQPRGALLVAESEGRLVGCVALRRWNDDVAEMKRLYVRPRMRGLGTGHRLVLTAIERARELGYRTIRLDTLPSMHRAIAMYQRLGFAEIEAYRENPVEGSRFFELAL